MDVVVNPKYYDARAKGEFIMQNNATEVKILEEFAQELPIHKSGMRGEGKFDYDVNVVTGELVPYVAELCDQLLSMKNQSLSVNIESYFSSLLYYRVAQIRGVNHKGMRDIAIPNFFYPVLASLGKYTDPMRAMALTPIMEYDPMTLEEMMRVSFEIRASGISVSLGLPRSLAVTSDEMFRVLEAGNEFMISGEQVSNQTLLIRTMVNMEFLKDVYAAPRTRYMLVEDAKPAWESIVLRTFLSDTIGR